MKIKFYFVPEIDDEKCYTLGRIIGKMVDLGLTEVKGFKAVRETNSEYFWCKDYAEIMPKYEGCCGKECRRYSPKNGKNGCCKFNGHLFTQGEEVIITI